MAVCRRRSAQLFDQPALLRRGRQQVMSAHHTGHAHEHIVDAHRQLIGKHAVGPPDHEIAAVAGEVLGKRTVMPVLHGDDTVGNADFPGRLPSGRFQREAFLRCETRAGTARIVLCFSRMRRRSDSQPRCPGAPAGIHKVLLFQLTERVLIDRGAGTLGIGRIGPAAVPREVQPAQVVRDRFSIQRLCPLRVEILHAEHHFPVQGAGIQPCQQHGKEIPHMHVAGRARCEAPCFHSFSPCFTA